jgi:prepilin-type N-terminal cleavage/methylation domain-containing protein/prepilin-type processing-associated H-X9-DG protein
MKIRFATKGFTLIELIVVIGIVSLLALVLIPGVMKARQKAHRIRCVSYLKQIGLSFRLWAGDHNDHYPMAWPTTNGGSLEVSNEVWRTFQVLSNELATPFVLACLADSRQPATDFALVANSNISYFVGLDADKTLPQLLLAGDRHLSTGQPATNQVLTIQTNDTAAWVGNTHRGGGNVAFADGSVQQWSGAKLSEGVSEALQMNREANTNATLRLAMPE